MQTDRHTDRQTDRRTDEPTTRQTADRPRKDRGNTSHDQTHRADIRNGKHI